MTKQLNNVFSNQDNIDIYNYYLNRLYKIVENFHNTTLKVFSNRIINDDLNFIDSLNFPTHLFKKELTNLFLLVFANNSNQKDTEYSLKTLVEFKESKLLNNNLLSYFSDNLKEKDVLKRGSVNKYKIESKINELNEDLELNNKWFRTKEGRTFINKVLGSRQENIAQNYAKFYKDDIKRSFNYYLQGIKKTKSGYIRSTKNIEKNLTNDLALKNIDDVNRKWLDKWLTMKKNQGYEHIDREEFLNNSDHPLRKEVFSDYGLRTKRRDVVNVSGKPFTEEEEENEKGYYNRNQYNRLDRIIQTETNASYNLALIDKYIKQGYTQFRWETDVSEINCKLCGSLHGEIMNITNTSNNWMVFRLLNTDLTWKNQALNDKTMHSLVPPIHGFCGCTLVPTGQKTQNYNKALAGLVGSGIFGLIANKYGAGVLNMAKEEILIRYQQEKEQSKNVFKVLLGSGLGIGGVAATFFALKNPMIKNNLNKYITTLKKKVVGVAKDFTQNKIHDAKEIAIEKQQEIAEDLKEEYMNKVNEFIEYVEQQQLQKVNQTIALTEGKINTVNKKIQKINFNKLSSEIDNIRSLSPQEQSTQALNLRNKLVEQQEHIEEFELYNKGGYNLQTYKNNIVPFERRTKKYNTVVKFHRKNLDKARKYGNQNQELLNELESLIANG